MVTVYVLESLSSGRFYVGMALCVHDRLREHNAGKSRYTKGHMPWKIIYTEEHADWPSARLREKYLKSAAGKKWLAGRLGISDRVLCLAGPVRQRIPYVLQIK